ncbi:MAG: hypothetical protein Crog4KO_00910 [Crocinitomicaceae bacterium]
MKSETIDHSTQFTKEIVGYQEDRNFILVFEGNGWIIKGSAKIPEHEMDEIIRRLRNKYS